MKMKKCEISTDGLSRTSHLYHQYRELLPNKKNPAETTKMVISNEEKQTKKQLGKIF